MKVERDRSLDYLVTINYYRLTTNGVDESEMEKTG